MIREADIEEMGINFKMKTGEKLVYNLLRRAYDTALCAESQEQAERLIGKVNNRGKARLLKLNVKNTQTSENREDTVRCRSYSG